MWPSRWLVVACVLLVACSSGPQAKRIAEQDREIAVLRQQVAHLTSRLEETHAALDAFFGITDSPPPLDGTITRVANIDFHFRVDDNPDAVELRTLVDASPFRVEIHDASGFKADALTIGFDNTNSCLVCRTISLGPSPIEGDRGTTASYRSAPSPDHVNTRESEIEKLRQQVADQTVQLKLANDVHEMILAGGGPQFVSTMNLEGVVTELEGRNCTIRIDVTPAGFDIAEQIKRHPFRAALYDANGYKAEVVSLRYDATSGSLFCKVLFIKDGKTPGVGDRATTK